MRPATWFMAGALMAAPVFAAAVKLPASGLLSGPLDDAQSSLGDEINNYPFGAGSGAGPIHGWISVKFDPPSGSISHFTLKWLSVGDSPTIKFKNGAYVLGRAVANFPSADQASEGDLNLDTGEVTNLVVHAVFQNALIHRTARNNRFPLSSQGSKFTVLFGDYPPLVFPFPLGYDDRPATSLSAVFTTDSSGNITGIQVKGTTFIAITVVQKAALMPGYSFGPAGNTIIPGADGCENGDQCGTDASLPDGIYAPYNAYLSPTVWMISSELKEYNPATRLTPPAKPGGVAAGAAAAAIGTNMYVFGGFDGQTVLKQAAVLDAVANKWSTLPEMPGPAWESCATVVAGRIYVIGGSNSPDESPTGAAYVFDPGTSTWTTLAPVPVPVRNAACANVSNRAALFGGWTKDAGPARFAWVFDAPSGQWVAQSPMPVPLAGAATAAAGTDLYFVSGTQDGSTTTTSVLVYSTTSGTWRDGPALLRGVYNASATYLAGRLMVTGGRTVPQGPIDVGQNLYQTQTMQVLPGGKVWYSGLPQPLPAAGMAGALIGDTWYLAGGDVTAGGATKVGTDVVQAYNPYNGWVVSDTHPVYTSETVRNAASLGVGTSLLSPGTQASILGNHLSDVTMNAPAVWFDGKYVTTDLPTTLGGVSVSVDGVSCGIVSVSPKRIDFQVPFSVRASATPRQATLAVTRQSSAFQATPVQVSIVDSAPGIFIYSHGETAAIAYLDKSGAVAYNQNGTLNFSSQPAHRGEIITVRATGLGDVQPRPDNLQRASRDNVAAVLKLPVVQIDGKPADVIGARLVPGEAGVYEIQVRVPSDSRTGVRVTVTAGSGDFTSNTAILTIQ